MAREFAKRFAGRIQWITFENQSGKDIPPFSIIEASGWEMPDPSGSAVSVTSPIILGDQPADPISPYACYITHAVTVPAGANGVCARPTLDLPLLVSVAGSQNDGNDASFRLCGPSNGSWQANRDMPGFAMIDVPQQGFACVIPTRGPYAGYIQSTVQSQASCTVYPATGTGGASLSQATSGQITNVWNPYGALTVSGSTSPVRVTYDWVNGSYELIAGNPCGSS
jgi:hypothetical protein